MTSNDRRPPLDTKEAAIYTNTRPNYLEKLRCLGGGPVFIKRKGAVRYDPDDLDAWLEAGKRKSTSDVREVA
jgi:choline dehydrogenase-like flavoprotein